MRYEYKIEQRRFTNLPEKEKYFNKLGEEGWRLISYANEFCFIREIPKARKKKVIKRAPKKPDTSNFFKEKG